MLPALSEKQVKLYFVSIGTPERGLEFVDKTGGLLLLAGSGCYRVLSLIAVSRWQRAWQVCPSHLPAQLASPCCLPASFAWMPALLLTLRNPFFHTLGFPAELLLCDPDGTTFSALNFKKGVLQTFFSIEVRCVCHLWGHSRPPLQLACSQRDCSSSRSSCCLCASDAAQAAVCIPTFPDCSCKLVPIQLLANRQLQLLTAAYWVPWGACRRR